jgi:hypothetical protein
MDSKPSNPALNQPRSLRSLDSPKLRFGEQVSSTLGHMKLATRLATVLYAAFALSGCNAEFDDVSEAPEHRRVVGELCQIQLPLNAHGVTLNIERNKRTDLIALTTLNLSGPEITFSTRLPAGTTLEIVAIRQCRNCPFDDGLSTGSGYNLCQRSSTVSPSI